MNKKIKVVLLCHFWNEKLSYKIKNDYLIKELAPWIPEVVSLFRNKDDIKFYVLAPNYGSNTNRCFEEDNIHFYFYRYSFFYISNIIVYLYNLFTNKKKSNGIYGKLNILTNYIYPKYNIYRIVKKINPDIIHLYGSENLVYSVGGLKLMDHYSVLVTIQGYAYMQNKPNGKLANIHYKTRIKIEEKINKRAKYITNFSYKEGFKPFENGQRIYKPSPITKIPPINASETEKHYDIVFYARVCKEKGIEDLLRAIELLKIKGIELKVLIIGNSDNKYWSYLKDFVKKQNIEKLIYFKGYIHNHNDVYKEAAKAKMLVLPTYNDGFNNTIREAMFMKLPVIANAVGGIPIANKHVECITLSEVGNIENLAEKIELVLIDEERTMRLVNNAYNEMRQYYMPSQVYNQILNIYFDIIKNP